MANIFRSLWNSTDGLTKWIQVAALCVAAVWTFKNYSVADKPSLEPNISVTSNFSKGSSWQPHSCFVKYSLTVRNEGKVSFDVDGIRFRAWRSETPQIKSHGSPERPLFLDAENFSAGELIIDQPVAAAHLMRHYAPGQYLNEDFSWLLPSQQPGITSFVVDVSATSGGDRKTTAHGRHWENNLCVQ